MSESDAIELQSKRLPPSAGKGSVWEPLVESESGHDISGRSSVHPLEPSHVETPKNEGRSKKKGYRRFLSLIPHISPLFRHLALVHLPPVAITLAVLGLYIANVRWSNPTNNALNALQFAAKIHEALIIVSVGDILLGRINHHLLNKGDSLPLGYLPSPLLLNSPFLYLISSELWAPIRSSRGRHVTQRATGAMILLSALLCIAASPLSAITMIPRQHWRLDDQGNAGFPWKHLYTPGSLYHNDLDAEDIPDQNYSRNSTWFTRPSQRSILETTITTESSTSGPFRNVTYSNYEATGRPMSYKGFNSATVAMCPLSPVARHLGLGGSYVELMKAGNRANESSILTKWKQPLVVAQCGSTTVTDGIAEFSFDKPYFNRTDYQTMETHMSKHPWLLNVTKNIGNSGGPLGYSFLNIKDETELPISTDIIFASVVNETRDFEGRIVPARPAYVDITLCFISARWTEADVWIETDRSSDALSHFTFANGEEVAKITESYGTRDFINIHEDWMTGIGSVPNVSANRSSYDEALRFCMITVSPRKLDPLCIQTFLAMHITDALAELGEFQEKLPLGTDDFNRKFEPENNSIVYTAYVYVYSYDFGGSIGISIAFLVLVFHVLLVLFYIPMLLLSEHLRNRPGWSSLGDLLVLTLSSDVEVDLTKGKPSQKWIKAVVVREQVATGRKVMVVRDHGSDRD